MLENGVRLLIVMRHAKAEGYAGTDHDRELTDRGRSDSRAAGVWLADNDLAPDLILVSSAARALGTADEVCGGLGVVPETKVISDLYGADEYDVVAICANEIPDETGCALVIGHNPTMEGTAVFMQPEDNRREISLPTAGIAVLEVPEPWHHLEPGSGSLVEAWTPHNH